MACYESSTLEELARYVDTARKAFDKGRTSQLSTKELRSVWNRLKDIPTDTLSKASQSSLSHALSNVEDIVTKLEEKVVDEVVHQDADQSALEELKGQLRTVTQRLDELQSFSAKFDQLQALVSSLAIQSVPQDADQAKVVLPQGGEPLVPVASPRLSVGSQVKDPSLSREGGQPAAQRRLRLPSSPQVEGVQAPSSVQVLNLERLLNEIKLLQDPAISKAHPRTIHNIFQLILPRLSQLIGQAYSVVDVLTGKGTVSSPLTNEALLQLHAADEYVSTVQRFYTQMELIEIDFRQKLPDELGQFDPSAQTIQDYLRLFKARFGHVGSNEDQARRLYNDHLPDSVKARIGRSREFAKLESQLLEVYGTPISLARIEMDKLNSLVVPSDSEPTPAYAQHFVKLYGVLESIESLRALRSVSDSDFFSVIASQSNLDSIFHRLPVSDQAELSKELIKMGKKLSSIRVEDFYSHLTEFITTKHHSLTYLNIFPSKSHKKAHLHATVDSGSPIVSTDSQADSSGAPQPKSRKPKPAKVRFPCPINGHYHSSLVCSEFLNMSAKDRYSTSRGKLCFTCLGPFAYCNFRCVNKSRPRSFTCAHCSKPRSRRPRSIVFCDCQIFLAPSFHDFRVEFTKFARPLDPSRFLKAIGHRFLDSIVYDSPPPLPGKPPKSPRRPDCVSDSHTPLPEHALTPTYGDPRTATAVDPVASASGDPNFGNPTYGDPRSATTGDPVASSSGDPNFVRPPHSHSYSEGMAHPPGCCHPPSRIILDFHSQKISSSTHAPAPPTDSSPVFLLQTLSVEGKEVVVFFDSGSSLHLVTSSFAKFFHLPLQDSSSSDIIITGGDTFTTTAGIYALSLRTDEGEVKDLTVQALNSITGSMQKQDLRQVANEAMRIPELEHEIFPEVVGGRKVDLLIGIKNPELQPVPIMTLPSGLMVFRSPFTDIYGSNLVFGGSHSSLGNTPPLVSMLHHVHVQIPDLSPLLPDLHNQNWGARYPHTHCEHLHVASGPLARNRRMCGEEPDFDPILNFRCSSCAQCLECLQSPKKRMVSVVEQREQEIINDSVVIDPKSKSVQVKLPFIKDPDPILSAKFKGPTNYHQAKVIYSQQTRKPNKVKEGIRAAFNSLKDAGFITTLSSLSEKVQRKIKAAPFTHYHPWRSVYKEDSVSTPVRLVVDPSMTGLNSLLAKGENMLIPTTDILTKARFSSHLWASDISKLYNRLNLHPDHYRYSLFLYDESLDPEVPPKVQVLTRAWYGVISSGNQSAVALNKLARLFGKDYPNAVPVITGSTYVDDMVDASDSLEERENRIKDVSELLAKGSLPLKYIIRSGTPLPEEAGSGESHTKILGYKYDPERDCLFPGVTEFNLNKKIKGARKPNPFPVKTSADVVSLLESSTVTRSDILGNCTTQWASLSL